MVSRGRSAHWPVKSVTGRGMCGSLSRAWMVACYGNCRAVIVPSNSADCNGRSVRLPPAPLVVHPMNAEAPRPVRAGANAEIAIRVPLGPHLVIHGGRLAGAMAGAWRFRLPQEE